MKVLKHVAMALVLIGALNWGLVGIFEFDLVAYLFSSVMIVAKIIYILVGVSGLFLFLSCLACHGCCSGSSCCDKK